MSYLVNNFNSGLGISSMYFLGDTTTYLTADDLTSLNTGISNNSDSIDLINVSLSNYSLTSYVNANIANLNTGISNNTISITTLSSNISASNYITASSSNILTNKTIDYNLNSILNLPVPSGGLGLTLLNTVSFTGGTQTISGISSSYKHLFIWFKDVRNYSGVSRDFSTTFNSTTYILNNGQIYLRGFMKIYNSGIVSNKFIEHTINQTQNIGCDVNTTTTVISTLQFNMSSETTTAGTIYLLGAN